VPSKALYASEMTKNQMVNTITATTITIISHTLLSANFDGGLELLTSPGMVMNIAVKKHNKAFASKLHKDYYWHTSQDD
jgi:phosphoserine aminotransferase